MDARRPNGIEAAANTFRAVGVASGAAVEVIQLKRRKARRVCLCCPASSALASPVVKTVFFFAEIL